MNTPVRRIAIAVMAMILLLMANLTYIQVVKASEYRDNDLNKRVQLNEYARKRGQISAEGQVLASSVETEDQLKYLRQYPDGPVYAPVTGYYSTVWGTGGIEKAENEVLNGSADELFGRRLSDLITGRNPSGGNVVLTLDPDMQQTAFEQLGNRTGAVVALRPKTGEILAMVSTPSFDPNPLASHDAATQQKAWTEYGASTPPVLTNRGIDQIYPPGSTFKLVDTAAALSTGHYNPDTQLTAAPTLTLVGTSTTLENYNGNACGTNPTVSLREALQRSCNTAFAQLVGEGADGQPPVGEDALRKQAEAFGIGQQFTIPMEAASSTIGDILDTAALEQSSIGQRDVALSPLQNAMIVAAIANGGEVMTPYLVKEIQSEQLETVKTFEPNRMGRAIDDGVARTLTDLMVNNENSYKPDTGKITGVQIAAKTGTAEHGPTPKTTPPHVWYVAFAPANDPQIAVAVLVESGGDGNDLAATGGRVAAPIGRAVIAAGLGKKPR